MQTPHAYPPAPPAHEYPYTPLPAPGVPPVSGPHYHHYAPGAPVAHYNHYYAAPAPTRWVPAYAITPAGFGPGPQPTWQYTYENVPPPDSFNGSRMSPPTPPPSCDEQRGPPQNHSASRTPRDVQSSSTTRTQKRDVCHHPPAPPSPPANHHAAQVPPVNPVSVTQPQCHTIRRVPVRYDLAISRPVNDMPDSQPPAASTRAPSRLETFPEAIMQSSPAMGTIDPPSIVVLPATESDLSAPTSPASSSPWSPPASNQSSPATVYSVPLHDSRSATSLVEPPVGELAGKILSQMNTRADESRTSQSAHSTQSPAVSGNLGPIAEVEEDATEEEEIDGDDPEEPLSLTYNNGQPFTITIRPHQGPKSYFTLKAYLNEILSLRRKFDSKHSLPSHPAIDVHTYDAHAAMALENRLSQDSMGEIAKELAQVKGKIAYKTRMNDGEGGAGMVWRLKKVEEMLEERRERMLEVARWTHAS